MDTSTVSAIIAGAVLLVGIGAWVGRYLKASPDEREDMQDQALAAAVEWAVTESEALLKGESGARRKAWVVAQITDAFPFVDPTIIDAAIEKAVALLNKQQAIATAGHRSFVPATPERRWAITRDPSYDNDREPGVND